MFVFLCVKANSKDICDRRNIFPFFWGKVLTSSFLIDANYLGKIPGYLLFSLRILFPAKIYFFRMAKRTLSVVGIASHSIRQHRAGRPAAALEGRPSFQHCRYPTSCR